MKSLTVATTIFLSTMAVMAQQEGSNLSTGSQCPAVAYAHRFSDMRMRRVQVQKLEARGLRFVGLGSIPGEQDNYLQLTEKFSVVRVQQDSRLLDQYHSTKLSKKKLKGGMQRVAIHRGYCKAVLPFRLS